jgi:hypothetical protein
VLPTNYPGLLAPLLVGGVAKIAFKTVSMGGIVERLPAVANVAISNVPGPPVPLYLAGARMKTFYPVSIITHGLALNITIQTYAGSVDFGLIGDKQAVPAIHDLTDALQAAFEQGKELFVVAEPVPVAKAAVASVVTRAPKAVKVPKATTSKIPDPQVKTKRQPSAAKTATVVSTTTARKRAKPA